MPSGNKIIIHGNLGRDPEMKFTPQGLAVCTFSVPSDDKRKDKNGEWTTNTTWFRITTFGKTAENCNKYLKKGQLVLVDGKLSQSEYTDKDGNKRQTLEVTANDVVFLGKAPGEDPLARPFVREQVTAPAAEMADDPDIPF